MFMSTQEHLGAMLMCDHDIVAAADPARVIMSSHEHSKYVTIAHWALMSTHVAPAPYEWVFMRALELLSSLKCS